MNCFKAPKWFIITISLVIGLISAVISALRSFGGARYSLDFYLIIVIAVAIPILFCMASGDAEDSSKE